MRIQFSLDSLCLDTPRPELDRLFALLLYPFGQGSRQPYPTVKHVRCRPLTAYDLHHGFNMDISDT